MWLHGLKSPKYGLCDWVDERRSDAVLGIVKKSCKFVDIHYSITFY